MPKRNYSHCRKSLNFWPLYEVTLFENWNVSESIQAQGHQRIIRLFYTAIAAQTFTNGINKLLGEIEDVPNETR